MFKLSPRNAARLTAAAVSVTAIGSSMATFTVPQELTDAAASVVLIGAAVFAIGVGVKLYKWLKSAL